MNDIENKNYSLDFTALPLTDFEKAKEKIPRQYSVVYPIRTVWPETRKNEIAEQVRNKEREFLESGVTALVKSDKDTEDLALTVARMKYGVNNVLFHDLGVGLHTALTKPNNGVSFYNLDHLKTNDGKIVKTVVTVSLDGLFKLALGPLVDDNGRAITGAGPVVKDMKDRLKRILYTQEPEPVAAATLTNKQGKKVVIYGRPLIVDKFRADAFHIQIDHYFFPMIEHNEGTKIKEIHLHHVAGLASVLSFGRYLLNTGSGKKEDYPKTPDAHKLLLYMQAAAEMTKFAPSVIKQQGDGRYNFVFRRGTAVKDLRPSAVNSEGRIRFGDFSSFVAKTGTMYRAALEELDIIKELHPKTLVPATARGAEFPKELPEIVYIKAENV